MKRRPDGRWQKRVTLTNGEGKSLYSTAKSERGATADFNRQLLELEKQLRDRMLFKNIAGEWNTEYRKRISDINYRKNTRAAYNRIVEYFSDYYIQDMKAPEVNRFIKRLALQEFGKKTVANHHSTLNMIYKYAVLAGYIEYNVMQDVPIPPGLKQKPRELPTDEELEIINSHYDGFDFYAYFLLHTGLRPSEALALEVDKDIDFQKKEININKHLIHDNNTPIIEPVVKTEAAERKVVLLDRVAQKITKTSGLLFCNDDGSPYTKKQLQKQWDDYRERYGLALTSYQLRHGFATMLYEAGIGDKDAQDLMGHADITTTRKTYTHIRAKRRKQTAEKLNKFEF